MKSYPEIVHSLKDKHILVTGGAGFIGSTITEALLNLGASVTVLDNLSTGLQSNVDRLSHHEKYRFVKGDICQPEDYRNLLKDIDAVSHQAALGSVPRSIEFPLNTHHVNATGFLTFLHEVKEAGIKRFVYASSSSVYGDSSEAIKKEGEEGEALSPYAVTKQLNEQYAGVYAKLHAIETIGLRYFNVFGPYQNPEGVYAAAIPKFLSAVLTGGKIIVNGDGEQTRDFTYVQNAVLANLLGLTTTNQSAFGSVFNVACGKRLTLNEVISGIVAGVQSHNYKPTHTLEFGPKRMGDIPHSLASITHIQKELNYFVFYTFEEGLATYLAHSLHD
ncbi:MAG: SDR family NAD(P)-dependent oxidoreductase [Fluviicola sp.]|nr:SDR family NAD(P)-dependent oxidoreductase [Fluviicola sp.]MBP6272048.1 SDR family NAD(P)-dependent oxidoreductase [Fluviicola sp.]